MAEVAMAASMVVPGHLEGRFADNPSIDFDKVVFVKRKTYTANHYYTKHINSQWLPGGNLCVLDLKTGQVNELVPELTGGVFERFDVAFDATRIVFAWKAGPEQGYRLYEIDIDPVTGARADSELRQLTRPPENEAELQKKYRVGYHHGTDDMQPCYLPDGGIAFVSTRCQYGILCDGPDKVTLADPKKAALAARLATVHEKVALRPDELLKISNWVDTNGQFYGMYWGRKNLKYRAHPNFRPIPTFERATSYESLIPEAQR